MPGSVTTGYYQVRDGRWEAVATGGVPEEAPLTLYVNAQELITMMATPIQQEWLALGFLANEGIIRRKEEVRLVQVCPAGHCVDVWLSFTPRLPRRPILTSGCGGGVTFDDLSRQVKPVTADLSVTPAQIADLMRRLYQAGRLYRQVQGIHTSALSDGERLLVVAEDVGRHNTLDKVRGACLMQGIETAGRVLLSTGRISSEMLNKAARMGVPVVVSRTSPTSLAVVLARHWGITLVGYARRGQMRIYAHPRRILTSLSPSTDTHNSTTKETNPDESSP